MTGCQLPGACTDGALFHGCTGGAGTGFGMSDWKLKLGGGTGEISGAVCGIAGPSIVAGAGVAVGAAVGGNDGAGDIGVGTPMLAGIAFGSGADVGASLAGVIPICGNSAPLGALNGAAFPAARPLIAPYPCQRQRHPAGPIGAKPVVGTPIIAGFADVVLGGCVGAGVGFDICVGKNPAGVTAELLVTGGIVVAPEFETVGIGGMLPIVSGGKAIAGTYASISSARTEATHAIHAARAMTRWREFNTSRILARCVYRRRPVVTCGRCCCCCCMAAPGPIVFIELK